MSPVDSGARLKRQSAITGAISEELRFDPVQRLRFITTGHYTLNGSIVYLCCIQCRVHAPRSIEEGAETAVWLATDAPLSINGQFLKDKSPQSW